ncbi:putative anthocyanidin reductase isoform X6 [Vigna angularis]|uniref:putative anthocyanidin reductase isoform X6 n=1 Tax=Phaseolus angularis TaxID=3914 RepID=UPI0022B4A7E6|nr:putative anthocyanidin reductase isoform X6 [Vigna angularis]
MKKVKPLLEIPGAESKLSLWKANLAEEGSFDEAIKGCIGVFHVATPIEFESKDPEVFGSSFKVAGCSIISRKKMQIITPHIFNDSSPMEAADMEDIRRNWASFILSVSRNLATLK